MGDFNYPDIDWETYSGTKVSEDFRNLVLDKFLNQHVDHATRGDNILDLILSTNESLVSDVTVNAPLGSGDHCLITFAIPLSKNLTANSCKMPNFYRADFSKMKENLISVPWTEILAPLNATDSWNYFTNKVNSEMSIHIPKKVTKVDKNPKWFSNQIKIQLSNKKAAWKLFKKDKSQSNLLNYKENEIKLRESIKNSKRKLERDLVGDFRNNPRKFFAYASKKEKCSSIGPLKIDNNFTDDNHEIV